MSELPEPDQASQAVSRALRERRDRLSGEARLPDLGPLSERILGEARRRSEQITATRAGTALSSRAETTAPGVPWWVWLAWCLAIAGVIAAWRLLL